MNRQGTMNTRIGNWFLGDEEKLWSLIRHEQKRSEYLNQLQRTRLSCGFAIFLEIIALATAMLMNSSVAIALFLGMLILLVLSYSDIVSKIRVLRLYELLWTSGQNR